MVYYNFSGILSLVVINYFLLSCSKCSCRICRCRSCKLKVCYIIFSALRCIRKAKLICSVKFLRSCRSCTRSFVKLCSCTYFIMMHCNFSCIFPLILINNSCVCSRISTVCICRKLCCIHLIIRICCNRRCGIWCSHTCSSRCIRYKFGVVINLYMFYRKI